MNPLTLIFPQEEHKEKAMDYLDEHFRYGQFIVNGSALLDKTDSYEVWLERVRKNAEAQTVESDWVVSKTFFAVRASDHKIVGMVDVRHELNDFLKDCGGHIAYSVRPTERNRGYATVMLQLALKYCADLGLDKVMLVCEQSNKASIRVIENCGGVLEKECLCEDGQLIRIYWIKTK